MKNFGVARILALTLVLASPAWSADRRPCAEQILFEALESVPRSLAVAPLFDRGQLTFTLSDSSAILMHAPGVANPVELGFPPYLDQGKRPVSLQALRGRKDHTYLFARTEKGEVYRTKIVPDSAGLRAPMVSSVWNLVALRTTPLWQPVSPDTLVEMDTHGSIYRVKDSKSELLGQLESRPVSFVAVQHDGEPLRLWAVGLHNSAYALYEVLPTAAEKGHLRLEVRGIGLLEAPVRLISSGSASFEGSLLKTAAEVDGEAAYRWYRFNQDTWHPVAKPAVEQAPARYALMPWDQSRALMTAVFKQKGIFAQRAVDIAFETLAAEEGERPAIWVQNYSLLAMAFLTPSENAIRMIRDLDAHADPRTTTIARSGEKGGNPSSFSRDQLQWALHQTIVGLNRKFPEYDYDEIYSDIDDVFNNLSGVRDIPYWELLDYMNEKYTAQRTYTQNQ